ncbi:MAG: outer membrane protein [Elusimicrobiota bacterium]
MSKKTDSIGIHAVLFFAFLLAAAAAPRAASADDDDFDASRSGVSLGGRAAYDRPKDADRGTYYGGAQLRLHVSPVVAVEGSVDYRQNVFGATTVDVTPVQGSLLLYLIPHAIASPYVLGGEGWYYTHVRGTNGLTTNRFGPHAGAGVEIAIDRHWTLDGSYRYLWTQSLTAPTAASPAGKNFGDNGFMLTAAINYRF